MRVLGIESSCDDTAAAIVEDGRVLANVVASQDDIHRTFGGIVPELASRSHMRSILPVIDRALAAADISLDDVDAIAATNGPGLVGSLLVGLCTAKAIAMGRGLPFVGVNHLEGHLLSAQLDQSVAYPYLALIVSGGHTSLYHAQAHGQYDLVGASRDDAAGEAYDKVAKTLDLGFPGGPVLDKLAANGNPRAIRFPRARLKPRRGTYPHSRDAMKEPCFDFSFSGLKTAVWQFVRDNPPADDQRVADIAASFQEAVVDMLLKTTLAAADSLDATRIVIAGGVSANSRLRARAAEECSKRNIELAIPPMKYCTDNASMIAYAGWLRLQKGQRDSLDTNASANLQL